MFGCQQVLIKNNKQLTNILEFICSEANKLTNCRRLATRPTAFQKAVVSASGIYYARQLWFKVRKYLGKFDLINEYKSNPHYQLLHSQAAQQTLLAICESFKSYYEKVCLRRNYSPAKNRLDKQFRKGKLEYKPKLPNYRKSGLAVVSYPKQALKLINGFVQVPLGLTVSRWFGLKNFLVRMLSNLRFEDIRELRVLPRNQCFYVEFVYKLESEKKNIDFNRVLGIDPGLNNWLTCISNVGTSIIIDGLHLKSLNQFYNKQVSTIKEKKPQGFWSNKLAAITEKRNRVMRDAVKKAARKVINHCLENRIGNIVFGWNKGHKNSLNMGRVNNQKFVSIPTAKLKDRIAQLCEQYGIKFAETEESYTSKASFVDNDFLPQYGEKPEPSWKSSGKRTKRGLFRTAARVGGGIIPPPNSHLNWYINADANGAANILRKVSTTLGLDLSGGASFWGEASPQNVALSRGALSTPLRIALW